MADERDELDEVLERAHASALTHERRAYGKDLIARARSIRAREHKLAGLATWFYQRFKMTIAARGSQELSTAEWDFVQRYEEACK